MSIPVAALQQRLQPLFPGLMGLQITEAAADRIVATMQVRPDLCTSGGILHGGAVMAFADTLGAVGTFINLPEGKGTTTIESSTSSSAPPRKAAPSRRKHAAAQGPHDHGLADDDPRRQRQALRGHADAAGPGLSALHRALRSWASPSRARWRPASAATADGPRAVRIAPPRRAAGADGLEPDGTGERTRRLSARTRVEYGGTLRCTRA